MGRCVGRPSQGDLGDRSTDLFHSSSVCDLTKDLRLQVVVVRTGDLLWYADLFVVRGVCGLTLLRYNDAPEGIGVRDYLFLCCLEASDAVEEAVTPCGSIPVLKHVREVREAVDAVRLAGPSALSRGPCSPL